MCDMLVSVGVRFGHLTVVMRTGDVGDERNL